MPCVLLIKIIVGQGPTVLPVDARGGCWIFFLSPIIFVFFLTLEDDTIWTEILTERAVKPKTTNIQVINNRQSNTNSE